MLQPVLALVAVVIGIHAVYSLTTMPRAPLSFGAEAAFMFGFAAISFYTAAAKHPLYLTQVFVSLALVAKLVSVLDLWSRGHGLLRSLIAYVPNKEVSDHGPTAVEPMDRWH